jgi:hypothetical protein
MLGSGGTTAGAYGGEAMFWMKNQGGHDRN